MGQNVLDIATNFNAHSSVTDSQSGFRAFRRTYFTCIQFPRNWFGIESEMLIEASNANLKIKEVEISVSYDPNGSKQNPIRHGVTVLVKLLQDMEFNRPLYYFTISRDHTYNMSAYIRFIILSQYLRWWKSQL